MLGASITGIDAFQHCVDATAERLDVLQRAIERKLKCSLKTVQITDFEDDAGFDLIWMEQTFHHLEPRAEVLKRIAKLLRPGGRVVFSEANALNPLLQLQLLQVRGFKMFVTVETNRGKVIWGNERVLSRGSLKHLLEEVGIEQEIIALLPGVPGSAPCSSRCLSWSAVMPSSSWLAPMFTHYNLVGRKVA